MRSPGIQRSEILLCTLIIILLAVIVSGCEEWLWVLDDDEDTNITVTLVMEVNVKDLDGNPVPDGSVFFVTGKMKTSDDVPDNVKRARAITDQSGKALQVETYTIDRGDAIWYGASTYALDGTRNLFGFGTTLFADNDTIFYSEVEPLSKNKKATVARSVTLYKLTNENQVMNFVSEHIFDIIANPPQLPPLSSDESPTPTATPMPSVTPTPTPVPGKGSNARIDSYGMSSTTIKKGDKISAYMDITNTGEVPIKNVHMVGQIFVYDSKSQKYVLWENNLLKLAGIDPSNIRQSFEDINIGPGQQYRAVIEKEVPRTHTQNVPILGNIEVDIPDSLVTGKYRMIVRVEAEDAGGKIIPLGIRSADFEIVPGG
ncbi:hypothetical protein CUJ83_10090 [Methanocella sp. CWC-04]|uniref:Uncharacterized protein n=1 Tax=Methanooceanicella nereidis TaxID=2052831 RepID=A0AAP2W7M4_9EURY|nr:hypothetical protein [Methanocella sp. CWC-04]MCD1295349.1 hypothetical protein [Methanocella sp. CWC-04]